MVEKKFFLGGGFLVVFLFSIFQIMKINGENLIFSFVNISLVVILGLLAVYVYESLR